MQIDGSQASIITDRCTPPEGLGSSPSTIKLVLFCLRGLGAPGADLCVPSEIIEQRTCLKRRAVARVMTTLREHGILTQTQAPAPGRAARYQMHYETLAEWLQDGDLQAARLPIVRTKDTRTSAPKTHDRAHERHTINPSCAPETTSCASQARSCAPETHDIKEETAFQQNSSSSSKIIVCGFSDAERRLAAAAAGEVDGGEEWEKIAKSVGLQAGEAGQLAQVLVSLGVVNREIGQNALERISERIKGGGVQNPSGLLRTLLSLPEGVEKSKPALTRERVRVNTRKRLIEAMGHWDPDAMDRVEARVLETLVEAIGAEHATALMPDGHFVKDLSLWPAMLDFIASRWTAEISPAVFAGATA